MLEIGCPAMGHRQVRGAVHIAFACIARLVSLWPSCERMQRELGKKLDWQ